MVENIWSPQLTVWGVGNGSKRGQGENVNKNLVSAGDGLWSNLMEKLWNTKCATDPVPS